MSAEDLSETTLDPDSRTLKRVTIKDMEDANELIEKLMGKDVAPRKEYVFEHAGDITVSS